MDFEAGGSWREGLTASGFDAGRPTVAASTGVSMYLTKDAVAATLREVAALAREAGLREARHVSAADLARRYFAGKADGLRPPDHSEELLVATT